MNKSFNYKYNRSNTLINNKNIQFNNFIKMLNNLKKENKNEK